MRRATPHFSTARRRAVLQASAVGIIVYSIAVLIYSNLVPDLGLDVFGRHVGRVEEDVAEELVQLGFRVPQKGDQVVSIAGVDIDRLPRYVNTVANLWDRGRFPPEHLNQLESIKGCESPVAEVGGERYVRIRFLAADEPSGYDGWFRVAELAWQRSAISIAWLAMESVIFWMGWMVFRRRPEDDSAAIFFLMCIVTVGAYMGGYHWLRIASHPGLTFVFALCATAVPQVSLHFYLLFPVAKRFVVRHPVWTLCGLYLVPAILQVWLLWTIGSVVYAFRHQLPTQEHLALLAGLVWAHVVLGVLMFMGCVGCLVHSYLTARQPIHRQQVRWLLAGALGAGVFVAYLFGVALWGDAWELALGGATWPAFAASLVFTFTYAISILRYRLVPAGDFRQRGIAYLAISFAGGACFYGLLLLVVGFAAPRLMKQMPHGQALLVSTLVTLVLLTLTTVRARVQKLLDRRFYREKHRLDRALRRMDEVVGQLADRDTVAGRSLLVVSDVMGANSAAIYVRGSEGELRLAHRLGEVSWPDRFEPGPALLDRLQQGDLLQTTPAGRLLSADDEAQSLLQQLGAEVVQPLAQGRLLLGCILVGPPEEGMYSSDDLQFLAGLAELASVSLRTAESQHTLEQLNEELRGKVARFSKKPPRFVRLESPLTEEPDGEPEAGGREPSRVADHSALQGALVGTSAPIRQMFETVRKVASSSATTLIRGESGTGKSLLAEIIHRNSARGGGPFVKVHCAALSPTLLESELFGHVKGAFTGAHRDKRGRFQSADGGTLFLDEIGDISPEVQTKLLRVLQERTFEPVGSSEPMTVDVRIIAATHQPLEELVRRGRWREDLYYRLNVISFHTPPLRERREDIVELAIHFLQRFAQQAKKAVRGIDEEVLDILRRHDWPGNVRELENVIERMVVLADSPILTIDDLPLELRRNGEERDGLELDRAARPRFDLEDVAGTVVGNGLGPASENGQSLASELDEIERLRLVDALARSGGNKSKAAALLGIPRSTFCSKLRRFGIF